jgi:ferredoxin-NADP reductase
MGRPITGVVTAVRRETRDTVTLELAAEGALPPYQAGQFLTIDPHQFLQIAPFLRYLEAEKGRTEPPRAYSMSSAPYEPALAITIKEEEDRGGAYPALLSPLLMHGTPPGTRVEFKGFDGLYTLPPDVEAHDLLLHLCSGSGIVPNFGLIKAALHRSFPGRQALLYESAAPGEIIFEAQLDTLEATHPDRIAVRHFLAAVPNPGSAGPKAQHGLFGRAEIERALAGSKNPLVFLCGPGVTSWAQQEARRKGVPPAPRFIERIRAELKSIGLDRHQIRTEIFG